MVGIQVTDILEERLNKSVYNGAIGGTCMAINNEDSWEAVSTSQWNMVKFAQAMYADDWTVPLATVKEAQKYQRENRVVVPYFYPRILGLSQIDFSQVEIVLIEHGTNDYNSGVPLDSAEDPMDIDTFGGALRTTLQCIQERYPHLRIILVSPIYCEIQGNTLQKCYKADFGGGILDEYVNLEKEIAEEYGVEWIDMYHGSGIWEDNIDTYLFDKLHPTVEGVMLLGNMIADYLEKE